MKEIVNNSKKYSQKIIIVDDLDFEWLNQFKWYVDKRRNNFYALTFNCKNGKKKNYMHRLILGLTDRKEQADHKDRCGLNNQRDNLRITNNSQNNCNKLSYKNSSSKFKGVSFRKDRKLWEAYIQTNKRFKHLGTFETEEEAAREYDNHAKILHGEFAALNFKN